MRCPVWSCPDAHHALRLSALRYRGAFFAVGKSEARSVLKCGAPVVSDRAEYSDDRNIRYEGISRGMPLGYM